jgi:hypothetical protein
MPLKLPDLTNFPRLWTLPRRAAPALRAVPDCAERRRADRAGEAVPGAPQPRRPADPEEHQGGHRAAQQVGAGVPCCRGFGGAGLQVCGLCYLWGLLLYSFLVPCGWVGISWSFDGTVAGSWRGILKRATQPGIGSPASLNCCHAQLWRRTINIFCPQGACVLGHARTDPAPHCCRSTSTRSLVPSGPLGCITYPLHDSPLTNTALTTLPPAAYATLPPSLPTPSCMRGPLWTPSCETTWTGSPRQPTGPSSAPRRVSQPAPKALASFNPVMKVPL